MNSIGDNNAATSASAAVDVRQHDGRRSPWWRSRPWRVLCWLLLVGSLLALAAPWLAVHVWLGFDVFSHFMPHFAALAVAALACLLWPRSGPLLALLLLLAMPLLLAGLAYFWRMPDAAGFTSGKASLRVMSFNTWRMNRDVAALEAEIRRVKPDVVGLIEFSGIKRLLLRNLQKIYPHQTDCLHKPYCHLVLLSRWPIMRVRAASLWAGPPYLHATVRTPAGLLHVFVVHTLRFPWLGSQLKQVHAMARIVRSVHRQGPIIVMGDFNATPFSRMVSAFQQHSGLRRITWLPSWPLQPLPLPQIAIDHMFISTGLRVLNGPYTGHAAGSDHLPVVADFALAH